MLHTETVEAGTLALIQRLSGDVALRDFTLVGGTALSLQLGHRKSIDLDFFSKKGFDARAVAQHLAKHHHGENMNGFGNTLLLDIGDVKLSFLAHQYPSVAPPVETDGVRMASLPDIGALKLNAIVNSGRRLKDYVDMHFLLQRHSLEDLLGAFGEKYPGSNPAVARNALLYHKEIDLNTPIDLVNGKFNWADIARRFKEAVRSPKQVFEEVKFGDGMERNQRVEGRKVKRKR
ncbi:MAG TPA: nucleotidyl transferase AbiEii/AbiGii toxin family protein [Puia sp.]|jgi:hypothetical protein|nr:nucleotidyl transferase AbiEii/AbiGii toxin family protein [Puia sp.]